MTKVSVLGGGNIGKAIARGIAGSGLFKTDEIVITGRKLKKLEPLKEEGFQVSDQNPEAVKNSEIVIIAVLPQQLDTLLEQIAPAITKNHLIISIVSGANVKQIRKYIGNEASVIRAMPNTAIAIGESMTCLAGDDADPDSMEMAKNIFNSVGLTLVISEEQIVPATALCACGTAFFLRAVRAASQGGIEIGFHAEEALLMAAQTAKGAAALLTKRGAHPEGEVDKVTTPMGCTIAGLNQMEHHGFSSAMIRGIVSSAEKAAKLYGGE